MVRSSWCPTGFRCSLAMLAALRFVFTPRVRGVKTPEPHEGGREVCRLASDASPMLTAGEVPADLPRVWLLGYFPRRLSQLIEPCVRSRLSLFGAPNGGSLRFGGAVSQVDRRLSNGAADERTRRTAASASHTPLQSYSRWWAEKGLFHRCLVKSSQQPVTGPRCSRSARRSAHPPQGGVAQTAGTGLREQRPERPLRRAGSVGQWFEKRRRPEVPRSESGRCGLPQPARRDVARCARSARPGPGCGLPR
jgi:hypothetical protein